MRVSNFLLWQIAYAEIYVTETFWPDFRRGDLLEAIVYPSASFVRSYEPLVIATKSGDLHNGVVRQENDDEILLATGPRTEVRIAQDDIKEMRPGTVSVMPAGLEEQISRQELIDLVTFLKGTRWGAQ